MCTRWLPAFILVITITSMASSQTTGYRDRLARVRDVVDSKELVMIWSEGPTFNTHTSHQRIYDLDLLQPVPDSTLVRKPVQADSLVPEYERMSVAAGNFLGGEYKQFVAAWTGPNNTVTVIVPHIDPATLSWSQVERLSIPGLNPLGVNRKIHVATGDFFGDRQDEFVLGFQGADTTIHLQIYSFDPGSLVPHLRGTINDEHTRGPVNNIDNWDIITGDFNGDGYHDIALLWVKPLTGSDWALYAKIYTVDDQGNIIPKGTREIFHNPGYQITTVNISAAPGDFDNDAAMEIAFGFNFFQGEQSGFDTYVYLLDVQHNLDSIYTSDATRIARNDVGPNDPESFGVGVGDLNHNGRDDIVVMSGSTFHVYRLDGQGIPQHMVQQSVQDPGTSDYSDHFLEVGDMDRDGFSEVVIARDYASFGPGEMEHFSLYVYGLDSSLSTTILKGRRLNENEILSNSGGRHYAIALGDFDGDRVRLGPPVHYQKKDIMQPTVVLYSPPTHYDIFDTTIADLSGCYPGQSCGFTSSYIQSTTMDTTVTTESHEDWGVGGSIFVQLPDASSRVSATYGETFSRQASSTKSYTITTGRIAAGDDWIYANVYDIDFYEYPVYDGDNPDPKGYFLVSIPGTPRPLWIESKDDDLLGNLFRPDHEVGNVLSYPTTTVSDTARVITDFPEQTIGSTGSSLAKLQLSSFTENNVTSSWDEGLDVTATLGAIGSVSVGEFVSVSFPVGVEVSVSGHYSRGEITTQTVRAGQSLEVESDLGHLQPQYGTSGTYYVRPYAYWTSYGALALDYKVTQLPTGASSFWQTRYGGKTDLAFSRPWRYDPQKGLPFPGNDPTYIDRTRDIFLSKPEPHGGDTVGIYMRIRNFGLQAVTTPFPVRVYDGNPSSGGILLGEAMVDTTIQPRSYVGVVVPWAIPLSESLQGVRLYAVIDPDNAVTNEVHEDNNMGWAPAISLGGGLVPVQEAEPLPSKFALYQSYPNPFNPMTTIPFDLPVAARVSLKVFNVLGQEVVTLADEVWQAGNHHVHFNAAGLPSGVYFYRMQATPLDGKGNEVVATRKAVLLK
jgi:Secretion system C-terminal sorting domain/FG-GAP-like repeat